jgi:hypothetical protein
LKFCLWKIVYKRQNECVRLFAADFALPVGRFLAVSSRSSALVSTMLVLWLLLALAIGYIVYEKVCICCSFSVTVDGISFGFSIRLPSTTLD